MLTTEDGVGLFVQKVGSGPNAVIIPNAVHMFDSFQHLAANRTVIFFDMRNRGRSETVTDASKLARGIHHDIEDIEAVRRHFGFDKVDLIGHSYLGLAVILYAMTYPEHVNRVVQIGPMQAKAGTQYPAHLMNADATLAEFPAKLAQAQSVALAERGQKFWEALRVLMVANPEDAGKIQWTPFDCPNELMFMKHWTENLMPSIQALDLAPQMSKVTAPVLTIHGTKDRQSPYGAGCEWASMLPNARLVTIENAAHVPWIEAPEKVFGAIKAFL